MDMKYDSALMNKLVNATEARAVEAYNALTQLKTASCSLSSYDWRDGKKKEFDALIQDIDDRLLESIHRLQSYLDYLQQKMREFESRG